MPCGRRRCRCRRFRCRCRDRRRGRCRAAAAFARQGAGQGVEEPAGAEAGGRGRFHRSRRRRHQEAQQRAYLLAQLGAGNDPVHEAVAQLELGPGIAGGQLLADRAGRDAVSGKSDEGVGFRDVHVAHGGERGKGAAGRGIAQDRDVGNSGRLHSLDHAHRLDELHQRVGALLHARPARRRDDDERDPILQGRLTGAGDLLAHDGTHRATHEPEVHRADGHGPALDLTETPDRAVADAGGQLRRHEPVRVRLGVHEPEGVHRREVRVLLDERALIHQLFDPRPGRDSEVVAAVRADSQALVELLVEEHLAAAGALLPEVFRIGVAPWSERKSHRHQDKTPKIPWVAPLRRLRAGPAVRSWAAFTALPMRPAVGREYRQAT